MMIYTTTYEGFTEQRKSAGHSQPQYKFAVWGKGKNRDGKEVWSVLCYNSRMDLAQAELRQRSTWYGPGEIMIAAVTAEHKTVKARPDVTYPGETFEVGGIKFGPDGQYGRSGEYRGWVVLLSCTGRQFRCLATKPDRSWGDRIYVPNGGLETRIKAIKAAIDAKVDAKVEA